MDNFDFEIDSNKSKEINSSQGFNESKEIDEA